MEENVIVVTAMVAVHIFCGDLSAMIRMQWHVEMPPIQCVEDGLIDLVYTKVQC